MQAGRQACGSILFLVGLFFVTNYVRTSPVRNGRVLYKQTTSMGASLCVPVVLVYPGDPGLTDEPGDRGPEQTDEPGDPGQAILAR